MSLLTLTVSQGVAMVGVVAAAAAVLAAAAREAYEAASSELVYPVKPTSADRSKAMRQIRPGGVKTA